MPLARTRRAGPRCVNWRRLWRAKWPAAPARPRSPCSSRTGLPSGTSPSLPASMSWRRSAAWDSVFRCGTTPNDRVKETCSQGRIAIGPWQERGAVRPSRRALAQALFQRCVQAVADIGGQRHRLRVTEDLDGLLGRVHHQAAVVAVLQMALQVRPGARVELPIEVTGKFEDDFFAVQFSSSFRKYLFIFWRSFRRARICFDFTAGTERLSSCAVSSVEISS